MDLVRPGLLESTVSRGSWLTISRPRKRTPGLLAFAELHLGSLAAADG